MILILTDEDEPTTDLVIDWLNYYNQKFIRISNEGMIFLKKIYIHEMKFEAIFDYITTDNTITIDTKDIKSYWYRRSYINWHCDLINNNENNKIIEAFNNLIYEENRDAIIMLSKILNRKNNINKFEDNGITKLNILNTALELDITVPETLICKCKTELLNFYYKHNQKIITKSIGDPVAFYKYNYCSNTNLVNINNYPDIFGLSLFQQMIDKYIELRIFYLNNTFYSSAIFSQLNANTRIDLKNYDTNKPNKIVPYKISFELEIKLHKLMKTLNINSGSIDMIVTPNLEYYFLEVNPIGQFEQVSIPCNYNLFKIIAQQLIG